MLPLAVFHTCDPSVQGDLGGEHFQESKARLSYKEN